MTLRQHDAEVAAKVTMNQAIDIRTRLLGELDELERGLRGLRETVQQIPSEAGAPPVPVAAERRRQWWVWKF